MSDDSATWDGFDGGVAMTRRKSIPNDRVSEPERDTAAVTETLDRVAAGDLVKIGMAIAHPSTGRTGGTSVMKCLRTETEVAGFERRVSLLHHDGDLFRLYMTGRGNAEMDPWEIVSCPYEPEAGIADMTDLASHGWVVGAEVVEG
ncbi:hypothetical protein [Halostella litorea]|uniref:hypothetical protein n=1 Tax=Halostella litorea TaxID=2528831 RepID=UPI0010918F9C|nr:hypothetical protein [Halostella litorea]